MMQRKKRHETIITANELLIQKNVVSSTAHDLQRTPHRLQHPTRQLKFKTPEFRPCSLERSRHIPDTSSYFLWESNSTLIMVKRTLITENYPYTKWVWSVPQSNAKSDTNSWRFVVRLACHGNYTDVNCL